MKKWLPLLCLLIFCPALARATNITCSTSNSEDRIQVLRGMADVLIKESQEMVQVKEGEELVVKKGGKTEKAEIDVYSVKGEWKEMLSNLANSVPLDEIPEILRNMQQNSGQTFAALQDEFRTLAAAGGVTNESVQEFQKNSERYAGAIMEDLTIVAALRLKIDNALASGSLSPDQRVQIVGMQKMIADTQVKISGYQGETAKMMKMPFKIQTSADSGLAAEVAVLREQLSIINGAVDIILNELSANPSGMSQAWFADAQDQLNDNLKSLADLSASIQALLDANPSSLELQNLLREVSSRQSQDNMLMKDLAVVSIDGTTMTQMQEIDERLSDAMVTLLADLAAFNALGKDASQEQKIKALVRLFNDFEKAERLLVIAQRLFNSVMRATAGQKFRTAEQEELVMMFDRMQNTYQGLGIAAEELKTASMLFQTTGIVKFNGVTYGEFQDWRQADEYWLSRGFLYEFKLINDVTTGTLCAESGIGAGGCYSSTPPPPLPQEPVTPASPPPPPPQEPVTPPPPSFPTYLPVATVASPAQATAIHTALTGAVIGDVFVRNNVVYGVAARNYVDSPLNLTENSGLTLKQADLVAFMIVDGALTEKPLGTFTVYAGPLHAGLNLDSNGLSVYLSHTTMGNKLMEGEFYKLDQGTLAELSSFPMSYSPEQGWYPRVDESGNVEHLGWDSFLGDWARCLNFTCDNTAAVSALLYQQETDTIKADHAGQILNTAAYPNELPTDVVAKRLTGETTATVLGQYSHLSWGRWNDGDGVPNTIYTNSPWIAGSLTPAAAIPTLGSATYSGQVLGKLNEAGSISGITGTSALTANFANRTLTGSFTMNRADTTPWTNAAVNAGWGSGVNRISGTLAADNNMAGSVSGRFFGPEANQVGGSWALQNTDASHRAAGVFVGDKQ